MYGITMALIELWKKTHSVASTMCLMKASTNNDGLGGRLLVMKSHDLAGAAVTGQYDGGLGNNAIAWWEDGLGWECSKFIVDDFSTIVFWKTYGFQQWFCSTIVFNNGFVWKHCVFFHNLPCLPESLKWKLIPNEMTLMLDQFIGFYGRRS